MLGHEYRWSLISGGEILAHKLPGTASGDSSTKNIHEEQKTSVGTNEDRQYHSSSLYKQSRRYNVKEASITDQ